MGAGQSTPETPETPSSQAPQASQAPVCDFSKEQIVKLDQEIKKIDELILSVKRNENYNKVVSDAGTTIPDLEGARFAIYMSTLTGTSFEDKREKFNLNRTGKSSPLILEHLLYAQVNDILEEYKAILSSIKTLCEKYQSNCVTDVVVEQDIDKIISENFSNAQTHLNLFNQIKIPDTITLKLKETIGIINEINKRFSNIDNIKREMKTICEGARMATRLFSRAGGKSTISTCKKRKQMKMKSSSKHLSKTRNNKQKYNGKRVKK